MTSELQFQVVFCLGLCTILWIIYESLWRLFLSPLKDFPGPRLAAWTLWYEFYFDVIKDGGGQYVWEIEKMHKQYGPIVRISPFELHINDPEFYEEIYAGGNRERDKYAWQTSSGNSAQAMGFTVKSAQHRLRREALNPYFSKINVLRLEDRITDTAKRLCERIEQHRISEEPINLTVAYLALTMDIITSYAFGKSSGMLENEFSTKWKNTITAIMQNTSVINHFSWLPRLIDIIPSVITNQLLDLSAMVDLKMDIQTQVRNVLAKTPKNVSTMENHESIFEALSNSEKLPQEEKGELRLTDEATILVIAGSESPAKTLSLIHFYLMRNPHALKTLRHEIESNRDGSLDIPSLRTLQSLPFLTAVINEGLRMHGGITARSSRVAPHETLRYKQWSIPPGTPISTASIFIHRNPKIFPDPLEFKPERWLLSNTNQKRLDHYLVAFGRGTRNCVGLNLGMAEIYITLAHVVTRFDMQLFKTDEFDVQMVHDWYVPQPRQSSVGVQAKVVGLAEPT